MTHQSVLDLDHTYSDPAWRTTFVDLYSLSQFFAHAIVAPPFVVSRELADSISLTQLGDEVLTEGMSRQTSLPMESFKLALFATFASEELLIDIANTDSNLVRQAVDDSIVGGQLRFPWIFGRRIDDEFQRLDFGWVERLAYDQSVRLIDSVGQGVFQLGYTLAGPFGLLSSAESRILPPTRSGPALGCADPACFGVHPVELQNGESTVLEASRHIGTVLRDRRYRESGWNRWFFAKLLPTRSNRDDLNPSDLPLFLGNALDDDELALLTRTMINSEGSRIRDRFPTRTRFASRLGGSAQALVARLSPPEMLQILLLGGDAVIIEQLDRLIEAGSISIPPTEVRNFMFRRTPNYGGEHDITVEASAFGVRLDSPLMNLGVYRLQRMLTRLYESPTQVDDLRWKLRNTPGDSVGAKVAFTVRTGDPRTIVRELLLDSPSRLQAAFRDLQFGYFPMPASKLEEERLIDRLLWKLGFSVKSYPQYSALFWERIGEFQTAASDYEHSGGEVSRKHVRSESVNLFVSVEQVLDLSLSFVVWALLFDHYMAGHLDQFVYNSDAARSFMADTLNGEDGVKGVSGDPVRFDRNGLNTLDPLIAGLAACADVCDERLRRTGDFRRPTDDLPWYADPVGLETFPFLHTLPICDLEPAAAGIIIETLRRVSGQLRSANVSNVRNRIDHNRDDFPSRDEMLAVAVALRSAFEELESVGILPTVFHFQSAETDGMGRREIILGDYLGRRFSLQEPREFARSRLPGTSTTQVVFKAAHLPESLEVLRFEFRESSSFQSRWQQYPPRVRADRLTVGRTSAVVGAEISGRLSEVGDSDTTVTVRRESGEVG